MTLFDCNELKKRLVETTSFPDFHDYYFSNFVEKGRFMSMGRPLSAPRSEFLTKALGDAYIQLHGLEGTVIKATLVEIPEFGLIHGAVIVNGKTGSVLYFEDISMGMFTIVEEIRSGKTNYVRFSTHRPTGRKPT